MITQDGGQGLQPRLAAAQAFEDSELTWLPAWRLRELIVRREVSPVEVVEHFLGRIEALDPRLHAFRSVDAAGARRQAARAERAVLQGEPIGALHGVPIAVKEHIPVAGLTWHDLLTRQKSVAERDAVEIERLRAAGAILVGSTVAGLTALEFGASDAAPQNPWDLTRVCGDSSGGSACAVAAALAPLAIAVDGQGSTRLPAAFCGLVGLHPTRGRVPSVQWVEVDGRLLTTTGPLARDVRDAATVLSVLAGPDGRDLLCLPDEPPDYLAGLDDGAAGMRLAWTDDFGFAGAYAGADAPRVIETVRTLAFSLAACGATVEPADLAWEDPSEAVSLLSASDRGLATRRDPSPADVVRLRETRGRLWQAARSALRSHEFLLSPTIQYVAPTREEWATRWAEPRYMATYTAHTAMANLLGWPAITVPAGLVQGMPVGLQILGPPNSEPRMLQLAQACLALQA
jgi:Asp-tRNA(Asn)/Glu-tRNA(Gln) amidotransferase A subunit family amidase